jgi:chloramphenicol 3-O phosphotransferase
MKPGTILILNGTSSAGKTSLVRALQRRLTAPYLEAGVDKFLFMLPGRYLDRPLWDEVLGLAVQAGPLGHQLVAGMHKAIAALARAGNNVLADHVLVEPGWAEECAALFADLPAYLIAVRCPLEVLEARERARENRTLGQARAQFEVVHRCARYDFEVDTGAASAEACAEQIAKWLEGQPEARGLKEMREMGKKGLPAGAAGLKTDHPG